MASIKLTIDPNVEALVSRLQITAQQLTPVLAAGLAAALDLSAGEVLLAARNAGIESRTGTLLSEIHGSPDFDGALSGEVGIPEESPAARYGYLLGDEIKTIVPIRSRVLTIPIGENLTGAGVARYPTVAALVAEFGEDALAFRGNAIGINQGGIFRTFFAMRRQVTVRGRNVLEPTVRDNQAEMVATVQEHIDELVREVIG